MYVVVCVRAVEGHGCVHHGVHHGMTNACVITMYHVFNLNNETKADALIVCITCTGCDMNPKYGLQAAGKL